MSPQEYFLNYPYRLLWIGGSVLGILTMVTGSWTFFLTDPPVYVQQSPAKSSIQLPEDHYSLNLGTESDRLMWNLAAIEEDIQISLCPARPNAVRHQSVAQVRLNGSQQFRQAELPCRIYLYYNDQGFLSFQGPEGDFWIDLAINAENGLTAQLSAIGCRREVECIQLSRCVGTPILRKADEFPAGSPLRELSEAHWSGVDLVAQLELSEAKQRLEFGSSVLQVGEKDWICWKNGRWAKMIGPDEDRDVTIARMRAVSPTILEWDVWDSSYHRVATPIQNITNAHIKADEWMGAVRIRSDKQMSCSIEKQSVILRVGDWVLKENNRWRVLHKAEDRRQVVEGTKVGDLFVLDKIDFKQKRVRGRLFFANRAQFISIETMASNNKFDQKHRTANRASRKGKNL